jgi:hypothetical protein
MRVLNRLLVSAVAVVGLFVAGCNATGSQAETGGDRPGENRLSGLFGGPRVTVPAGAQIDVRLDQTLSSEHVRRGAQWQGVVVNPVVVDGKEAIPSGAIVEGIVVDAAEAKRGNRARLELGVRAVRIGERKTSLQASSEAVVAGSTRARNLGAIAGGAAAGALIGKATSDKPGTGALIGGAVATGAVAASKGYQVVLSDGTIMTFVVSDDVAVKVG